MRDRGRNQPRNTNSYRDVGDYREYLDEKQQELKKYRILKDDNLYNSNKFEDNVWRNSGKFATLALPAYIGYDLLKNGPAFGADGLGHLAASGIWSGVKSLPALGLGIAAGVVPYTYLRSLRAERRQQDEGYKKFKAMQAKILADNDMLTYHAQERKVPGSNYLPTWITGKDSRFSLPPTNVDMSEIVKNVAKSAIKDTVSDIAEDTISKAVGNVVKDKIKEKVEDAGKPKDADFTERLLPGALGALIGSGVGYYKARKKINNYGIDPDSKEAKSLKKKNLLIGATAGAGVGAFGKDVLNATEKYVTNSFNLSDNAFYKGVGLAGLIGLGTAVDAFDRKKDSIPLVNRAFARKPKSFSECESKYYDLIHELVFKYFDNPDSFNLDLDRAVDTLADQSDREEFIACVNEAIERRKRSDFSERYPFLTKLLCFDEYDDVASPFTESRNKQGDEAWDKVMKNAKEASDRANNFDPNTAKSSEKPKTGFLDKVKSFFKPKEKTETPKPNEEHKSNTPSEAKPESNDQSKDEYEGLDSPNTGKQPPEPEESTGKEPGDAPEPPEKGDSDKPGDPPTPQEKSDSEKTGEAPPEPETTSTSENKSSSESTTKSSNTKSDVNEETGWLKKAFGDDYNDFKKLAKTALKAHATATVIGAIRGGNGSDRRAAIRIN